MRAKESVEAAAKEVFGESFNPNAPVTPEQKQAFEAAVEKYKAMPDESASDVVMARAEVLRLQAIAEAEEREGLELVATEMLEKSGWRFDVKEMSTDELRAVVTPRPADAEASDYAANKAAAESRTERGVTPANDNSWNLNTLDPEGDEG